jgi:hypothetical protein
MAAICKSFIDSECQLLAGAAQRSRQITALHRLVEAYSAMGKVTALPSRLNFGDDNVSERHISTIGDERLQSGR